MVAAYLRSGVGAAKVISRLPVKTAVQGKLKVAKEMCEDDMTAQSVYSLDDVVQRRAHYEV